MLVYPQDTLPRATFPVQRVNYEEKNTQRDYTLSYDDMLRLLDEIESGELEKKCTPAELEKIKHFVAFLAKEGALPENNRAVVPSFRLTTILISGPTRVAAINGRLFRAGDELSGYRIGEIDEGQVMLVKGKEKLLLKIDSLSRYSFKSIHPDSRTLGFSK